jgi:hypothetical protein
MAFLIDAGWTQVIIGAIAVILTIVIYSMTKQRKSFSYEVVSEYPLISIHKEIKGKLQILLDGNPVENVHLLLIKFINDGNIPIAASDYERPITLDFKDSSNILSADYVKASPGNLITSLKITDNKISIEPMLMNGGDTFSIKILVGQYKGSVDVDARILGVKNIRHTPKQSSTSQGRAGLFDVIFGFNVVKLMLAVTFPAVLLGTIAIFYSPRNISINTSSSEVEVGKNISVWATVEGSYKNWSYQWNASKGTVTSEPSNPKFGYYTAPENTGLAEISVKVVGAFGFRDTKTINVLVVERKPETANSPLPLVVPEDDKRLFQFLKKKPTKLPPRISISPTPP